MKLLVFLLLIAVSFQTEENFDRSCTPEELSVGLHHSITLQDQDKCILKSALNNIPNLLAQIRLDENIVATGSTTLHVTLNDADNTCGTGSETCFPSNYYTLSVQIGDPVTAVPFTLGAGQIISGTTFSITEEQVKNTDYCRVEKGFYLCNFQIDYSLTGIAGERGILQRRLVQFQIQLDSGTGIVVASYSSASISFEDYQTSYITHTMASTQTGIVKRTNIDFNAEENTTIQLGNRFFLQLWTDPNPTDGFASEGHRVVLVTTANDEIDITNVCNFSNGSQNVDGLSVFTLNIQITSINYLGTYSVKVEALLSNNRRRLSESDNGAEIAQAFIPITVIPSSEISYGPYIYSLITTFIILFLLIVNLMREKKLLEKNYQSIEIQDLEA